MYGEGYPARKAVEVEHISDGVYVWYDPDEYGIGHEHYGEQHPAMTEQGQPDQDQTTNEVQ